MPLREQISKTTNIVERYNQFCKWLLFGSEGIIAENDPEEQQKRMRYTDILANALMLQNVADLTEALEKLKQSGYPVNDEDVAHLSPYLTRHIQRFGDYLLKTWHETPFPQEEEAYSA
jgi:Tn3 transposase DDE domain